MYDQKKLVTNGIRPGGFPCGPVANNNHRSNMTSQGDSFPPLQCPNDGTPPPPVHPFTATRQLAAKFTRLLLLTPVLPKPTAHPQVTHRHLQQSPWTSKPLPICTQSGLSTHRSAPIKIKRPFLGSSGPTMELTSRTLHDLAPRTLSLHSCNLTKGAWWHSLDLNPDLTLGVTQGCSCSVLSWGLACLPVHPSHRCLCGRDSVYSSPRVWLTQRCILFVV